MAGFLPYWESQREKFPKMYGLVVRYGCIQVSAAAIERVWSAAGRIATVERTALADDTFNKLLAIQINQQEASRVAKRKRSELYN